MIQFLVILILFFTSQCLATTNSMKLMNNHDYDKTNDEHFISSHLKHRQYHKSQHILSMIHQKSSSSLSKILNNPSYTYIIAQSSTIPSSSYDIPSSSSYDISSSYDTSSYDLSPPQFIYVVLTSIFITCLIVADVVGVKLFEISLPIMIFGHNSIKHTCGMLTFPITFLLGDIINEYYGPKAAKNTVFIGLAMSVLVFVVMNIAQAMPYLDKPFNVSKESFDAVFGSAKLMYIASICAYLIGSLSDIWIFGIIKKATRGKMLWLRATGSTIVSQLIDSFIVSYIAFSLSKTMNNLPAASIHEVMIIAATGYGLKFILATCLTPLLYGVKMILTEEYGLQPIPYDSEEDSDRKKK